MENDAGLLLTEPSIQLGRSKLLCASSRGGVGVECTPPGNSSRSPRVKQQRWPDENRARSLMILPQGNANLARRANKSEPCSENTGAFASGSHAAAFLLHHGNYTGAIAETSAPARSFRKQDADRVQLRGQHLGCEPRRQQSSPPDQRRP